MKKIMKTIRQKLPFALVPLLIAPLLISTDPALAAGDTPPRTISVQGEGVASARPDVAMIEAGVASEAKTAETAVAQNSDIVTKLLAVLARHNVAEPDFHTAGFTVFPVFERPRDGSVPHVTGYRVENRLSIRVRRLDDTGALLDDLVSAGANRISGPTLTFDDLGGLRDEARRQAVGDAKRRAALYAEALGVSVGPVLSLSETSAAAPPRPLFAVSEKAAARDVPIAAGEQEVRVTVSVTFSIK